MLRNATFAAPAPGRLDLAVTQAFPSVPRRFVREAPRGAILVDGRPADKGARLRGGETVTVVELPESCDVRIAPDFSIPRPQPVFEDSSLLAFCKPAGMPVQPLDRNEKGTLMNAVAAHWPETAEAGDDPLMGGALHRIDIGTSGLVMVARTRQAYENLRDQFKAQTVEKKYLAVVEGAVAVGGTLEGWLAGERGAPRRKMCDARRYRDVKYPMHAVTAYAPVGRRTAGTEERTLLEVTIFTGVTHQIRCQLAAARMHILNDTLYGAFPVRGMKGHALHALSARFLHPESAVETLIRAEPQDPLFF